jgi:nucleoside-diphosphate-sugar epimerase
MSATPKIVTVAGGSGFIGAAIVRRLMREGTLLVRVLTRDPQRARKRFSASPQLEFIAADVTDSAQLKAALTGADTVINAVQFDGYPVEQPRRGLTFERVDYGGTVALLEAAKAAGAARFIYISGFSADENSTNAAFRAKGRAESAIRASGVPSTVFRPSLVYGPDDRAVNMIAKSIKLMPFAVVPGNGKQTLQPLLVDDLAEAVALAQSGRGIGGTFPIGGPESLSFDDFVRALMEVMGVHRMTVHLPAQFLHMAGKIAQNLPIALFSDDAADFLLTDNANDNGQLIREFGLKLTPLREGLKYLARSA